MIRPIYYNPYNTNSNSGESYFRISHQEMIKGITGYGYFDELVIPIIENTAWEHELADSLGEAIAKNPKSVAILVRRHGMYVWGKTWEEAKRHGECLHYLFEVAISMKKLGMDFQSAPAPLKSLNDACENGSKKRVRELSMTTTDKSPSPKGIKFVLLDIEGTTTPIKFVKDVLFPYSVKNFYSYLKKNWDVESVRNNVKNLMSAHDLGVKAGDTTPCTDELLRGIVTHLTECVEKDIKVQYLKNLQGDIWNEGYSSGELKSELYDDVLPFFERCKDENIKIAIYSSGSRTAQNLLFKYSNFGDVRSHISCYFDTSVGQKQESNSYTEVCRTLGVDSASEIMFVTDILAEGQAAVSAGMKSVLAVRPGNAALPVNHGYQTVKSFENLKL